jgi:hypothetical protein
MDLLSTRTYAAQPEGWFLQMAENLLPGRAVAISLRDDLFDLLRHQSTYGNPVFRSDDLCTSNRGLVELYREVSSTHAHILRGARKPRQNAQAEQPEKNSGASYPDMMVIRGPAALTGDRLETVTNPVVLAEVLSASTRRSHRGNLQRLICCLVWSYSAQFQCV